MILVHTVLYALASQNTARYKYHIVLYCITAVDQTGDYVDNSSVQYCTVYKYTPHLPTDLQYDLGLSTV